MRACSSMAMGVPRSAELVPGRVRQRRLESARKKARLRRAEPGQQLAVVSCYLLRVAMSYTVPATPPRTAPFTAPLLPPTIAPIPAPPAAEPPMISALFFQERPLCTGSDEAVRYAGWREATVRVRTGAGAE